MTDVRHARARQPFTPVPQREQTCRSTSTVRGDAVQNPSPVIAWAESPLQLIGVAEWAALHETRVPLAGRLTPQMSETADELIGRGALFGHCEPYLGIPWTLLANHSHWLVGDGYSGQFRLAAAILRPRRVTFLDDGANAIAYADSLLGHRPYARPGVAEGWPTRLLVPFALEQILGRAIAGGVELFTAFDFGERRSTALGDLGARVERHRFEWTRASARAFTTTTGGRVLLGSARPVDGRMPLEDYLAWVTREASFAPVTYIPHRRESAAQRQAVAAITGVTFTDRSLPVELLLAGTTEPLEILTLPSSTTTTLPPLLEGTGSVIRCRDAESSRMGGSVSA